MDTLQTIQVAIYNKVAHVTLARPEVNNAFNEVMITELTSVFDDLGKREDVRVIVLSGSGKNFSAGADLSYMKQAAAMNFEQNRNAAKTMATMFRTIDRCPKPVLGKVHGAALGGGFGLCAVCDQVVAATNTKFGLTEIKLGILPAVIGPFTIAKIGFSNFRAYGLSGERFDSEVALRIGLIHEVVTPEELDNAIERKLEAFGSAAPKAIAVFKTYARELSGIDSDEWLERTATLISQARTGDEGREGITAFLEKRTATWVDKLP
ncbi:MAG: enoyl-CoA hydratase-related protein [bacterium]|nr:enoyl-CoA hydratase-related protein [bacterium]